MTLPCVLCTPPGGEPDDVPPESRFADQHLLREHLVEEHAKAVARAFLEPNPDDSQHFWLMMCVKYKDDGTSNEQNDAVTATPSPSVDEAESVESDSANTDLQKLLSAFLGSQDQENVGERPSRKRGASHADALSETKKGLYDDSIEMNDLASTPFDPRVFFENAAAIANASGLVEEVKPMPKMKCQICRVEVSGIACVRHAYQQHIKRQDMFECSLCDYGSAANPADVQLHADAEHEGAEVISNEDKYKSNIGAWMKKCFPEFKSAIPTLISAVPNGVIRSRESMINAAAAAASATSLGELFSVDRECSNSNSPARTPAPADASMIDDRTCQLCWEESRYPGRHIAQKHLKKPLYECPVCEGFGSYEGCTVLKHMHKVHPEVTDPQPISNMDKYADELRDLQSRCFPNRPMKLVRPTQSSRPRERHHCLMCDTQVAQSDRQRHVYHRHLQRKRIFECPLCDFASNYDVHRVKWHIKWMHKEEVEAGPVEPISHENEFRDEIDELNEKCFPGWQHRRRPFWWLDAEEADKRSEQVRVKMEGGEKSSWSSQPGPATPKTSTRSTSGKAKKVKRELSEEQDELTIDSTGSDEGRALADGAEPNDWTCRMCLVELKPSSNFLRHVAKEHLSIPLFQCPVCEGHGAQDAYEVKAHLAKTHQDTESQPISNIELHGAEIQAVYTQCFPNRKLKNVVEKRESRATDDQRVQCHECNQEMKVEDRQIHVYRHHLKEPRLYECPLCDFSHHACSSDVRAHIKYVHRDNADQMPRANLIEFSSQIAEWNDRCFPGWINRRLPSSTMEDFNRCRLCNEEVRQTSRHIAEAHLLIPLHQCPLCDYGAAESRLVKRHVRNAHANHKGHEKLEPIANVVARRADFSALHDKCFPGRPKRLSNITISDEGKRAKCKLCSQTVSRKNRMIHVLDKHVQRDIFECSDCDFSSTYDRQAVEQHCREEHEGAVPVPCIDKHKKEIRKVGAQCFVGWAVDDNTFRAFLGEPTVKEEEEEYDD